MVKHSFIRLMCLFTSVLGLTQCRSLDISTVAPTSNSLPSQIVPSTNNSQTGCILPAVQISSGNVRHFTWSEDSATIIYQEASGQNSYGYDIISGQVNLIFTEISSTSTSEVDSFDIHDYVNVFASPSREMILFTRGTPEKLDVYYKFADQKQENQLGTIQGYVKEVDWLNTEEGAIIAMDWQAPVYPEAPIYVIDFSKNELVIEIPKESDYKNIEYLGLTPDETRFMFVSYLNKVHLDRTVKVWNISTHEIATTPIFNPLDFHWVSETELISISQNPDLVSDVSILLYDINDSKTTYLSEADISVDPFISNAVQISPNGASIAYIENETGHLYWTACKY